MYAICDCDLKWGKLMLESICKGTKYSFLEWNIQGAGGFKNYTIPEIIVNTITEKETDIIVLVEFFTGNNFNKFQRSLKENYHVFISPFVDRHNQVLIALKKSKFEQNCIKNVVTINPLDLDLPEYLQVDVEICDSIILSIVGVRIKTNCSKENKLNQFEFLNRQIKSSKKVLCLGDFNLVHKYAREKIFSANVYGPRTIDNIRWSFVHKNGDKVGIDLIAAKGIDILKQEEDSISKLGGYKMYANYDWSFIDRIMAYNSFSKDNHLPDFSGFPNHAILRGSFRI